MEKIVCPKCGALNFRGFLTYPVCHQCHENLTKCGYCRHFPGEEAPCTRFDPASSVSSGSVRSCEAFEREPSAPASDPVRRPFRAAMWASVLTCTMFGLLAVGASFLGAPPEPSQLEVQALFPDTARVDEEFTAVLTIQNHATRRSERPRIRAANELFRRFRCREVSPSEECVVSGNYRYYSLPEVTPQETLEVALRLTPVAHGRYEVSLDVVTETDQPQSPGLTHTINVLPVSPDPRPRERRRGGLPSGDG